MFQVQPSLNSSGPNQGTKIRPEDFRLPRGGQWNLPRGHKCKDRKHHLFCHLLGVRFMYLYDLFHIICGKILRICNDVHILHSLFVLPRPLISTYGSD